MPYDAAQPMTATVTTPAAHQAPVAFAATQAPRQRTLRGAAQCSGVGVHSGQKVTLRILPALENSGITFIRTDLKNGARAIQAKWDAVIDTKLCSVIGNEAGSRVATVEHLMAALYANGIDNATIEIDGAEVPVMDGSSDPFVFLIEMAGVVEQTAPRRVIKVLKPVEVRQGDKFARLTPSTQARFACEIDFNRAPIHRQRYEVVLSADGFKHELSRARTFGFFEEVEQLQKLGFARGGSLDNAVVIKDDSVLNEGGLRYSNEFVRHKLLDAVGDLALAGAFILGDFDAYCPGHALNNQLLHALFADPSAWCYADSSDAA